MAVRFGAFEVDLASGELRKQGLRIRLQEQPFAVLAALLERPGEVVTREELIARLWPDGTVVDFDRGLNAAVTRLRQALSDSAETPRYVETVARRGYRFVGMVDAPAAPLPIPPAPVNPRPSRRWPAAAGIAAIALAGAGYWLAAGRSTHSDSTFEVTPLTTEPGFEQHASFSPDGTQLAFQWGKGDAPHVFVKLAGAGDPIRLTSAPEAEYGPAWSPDGRRIAFLRDQGNRMAGIYVSPALGGVERKVAETPAASHWALGNPLRRLDWTPDSRHLVASGPEHPEGPERLLLVSVESGEKKWLTGVSADPNVGDREPAVSPDGRTLAFMRGVLTTDESIYLMPLRSDLSPAGEPRLLTSGRNPTWTPDGREIVFRPLRVHIAGLARVGITGGKPTELVALGSGGFLPAMSRTGRLVFSRGTVDVNIWRQEITTTRPLPPPVPLVSSTARDEEAQYSPDGSRIAFQSNRSGRPEIWTCGSDASRCSQVTTFKGAFITGTPRWSPDGRTIAFDSGAEGRFNVYTIGAAGGPARRLTADPASGAIPSWSRDGKWIYYSSSATGRNEIWKIPSEGGASVQVTRNGGLVVFEALDRTALYYTKTENDATLWKSGLDGSGETAVLHGIARRAFVVSGDSVYCLRAEPGGATIRRFRFATGEDVRLAGLTKVPYLGLTLSPDRRYLLYSQIDQQGSDLMLVERFR